MWVDLGKFYQPFRVEKYKMTISSAKLAGYHIISKEKSTKKNGGYSFFLWKMIEKEKDVNLKIMSLENDQI